MANVVPPPTFYRCYTQNNFLGDNSKKSIKTAVYERTGKLVEQSVGQGITQVGSYLTGTLSLCSSGVATFLAAIAMCQHGVQLKTTHNLQKNLQKSSAEMGGFKSFHATQSTLQQSKKESLQALMVNGFEAFVNSAVSVLLGFFHVLQASLATAALMSLHVLNAVNFQIFSLLLALYYAMQYRREVQFNTSMIRPEHQQAGKISDADARGLTRFDEMFEQYKCQRLHGYRNAALVWGAGFLLGLAMSLCVLLIPAFPLAVATISLLVFAFLASHTSQKIPKVVGLPNHQWVENFQQMENALFRSYWACFLHDWQEDLVACKQQIAQQLPRQETWLYRFMALLQSNGRQTLSKAHNRLRQQAPDKAYAIDQLQITASLKFCEKMDVFLTHLLSSLEAPWIDELKSMRQDIQAAQKTLKTLSEQSEMGFDAKAWRMVRLQLLLLNQQLGELAKTQHDNSDLAEAAPRQDIFHRPCRQVSINELTDKFYATIADKKLDVAFGYQFLNPRSTEQMLTYLLLFERHYRLAGGCLGVNGKKY